MLPALPGANLREIMFCLPRNDLDVDDREAVVDALPDWATLELCLLERCPRLQAVRFVCQGKGESSDNISVRMKSVLRQGFPDLTRKGLLKFDVEEAE